ncbi:hypothetical protein ACLOJK_035909 [Asimina triloba]
MPQSHIENGVSFYSPSDPRVLHRYVVDDVIINAALNSWTKSQKSLSKKKEAAVAGVGNDNSEGRKCLHCMIEKLPQWQTGSMRLKALCNACGMWCKFDRLVLEYHPAASPTFILTKHSNSHWNFSSSCNRRS